MRIVHGDPHGDAPASFSRFVQPFSYRLRPIRRDEGPKASAGCYRELSKEELQADHKDLYLTDEAYGALYESAVWFELQWHAPRSAAIVYLPTTFYNRTLDLAMHPPRIVLFNSSLRSHGIDTPRDDPLQVGLLLLDLYFPDSGAGSSPPQLGELLEFNEAFRHWRRPFEGHEAIMHRLAAKWPEELRSGPRTDDPESAYSRRWTHWLKQPVRAGGRRYMLLADESEAPFANTRYLHSESRRRHPEFFYADTRALVWTCVQLRTGADELSPSDWQRLVNVDGPASSQSHLSDFEREWIDQRTYRRWAHRGTLYGFSYHSGAMASGTLREPPLWRHFQSTYFDFALLLFYLRLALFRFSFRLYELSADARTEGRHASDWSKHFEELRWAFVLFTNLHQFPLVSNQQQGIEIYQKLRQAMDADSLFHEIQTEIQSSHDYLTQVQADRQNELALGLNIVAAVGLTLALATGFLGMNLIYDQNQNLKFDGLSEWGLIALTAALFGGLLLPAAFYHVMRSRRGRRWAIVPWLAILAGLLLSLAAGMLLDRLTAG